MDTPASKISSDDVGVSPVETVKAALGAVVTGDLETAAAVISKDFVWHIPGRSSISGEVHGSHGWSQKLQALFAAGLRPEILAMLEGRDRVAVIQRNVAEVGDHALDIQVVNLFSVVDGKVQRLDTYFSDQHGAEDFWNAVLPRGV